MTDPPLLPNQKFPLSKKKHYNYLPPLLSVQSLIPTDWREVVLCHCYGWVCGKTLSFSFVSLVLMTYSVSMSYSSMLCCSVNRHFTASFQACETAQCSFKERFLLRSCGGFTKRLCGWHTVLSAPPVNSSSCAQWPSKCCCESHTTRSGRLTNQSVVDSGPLPHRNAKGGQYEWAAMSCNRKEPIVCNACCNALVLYVTQECAEDVSGVHTHIYTVCIHIRREYYVFKALMCKISDFQNKRCKHHRQHNTLVSEQLEKCFKHIKTGTHRGFKEWGLRVSVEQCRN